MEVPRGVEPTGTNGRTRHTLSDPLAGSGLVLWWFLSLDGKEHCFLVVTETIPVKRFARVRCPVPGPPRSESWHGSGSAGRPVGVGRYIGFAVVMAQVRRPVPFRTRKLRPGRGDGTALERVWESSTPPHSTSGFPSSVTLREPFFLFVFRFPGDPRARRSGNPLFLFPHTGVSSAHWRFSDAGRPVGGRIVPVSGGIGTTADSTRRGVSDD